jgi:hypothetical protein
MILQHLAAVATFSGNGSTFSGVATYRRHSNQLMFSTLEEKKKDVYNLQTAICRYFKFHKIFSVPFVLSLDPVYVLNLPYFQFIC